MRISDSIHDRKLYFYAAHDIFSMTLHTCRLERNIFCHYFIIIISLAIPAVYLAIPAVYEAPSDLDSDAEDNPPLQTKETKQPGNGNIILMSFSIPLARNIYSWCHYLV